MKQLMKTIIYVISSAYASMYYQQDDLIPSS